MGTQSSGGPEQDGMAKDRNPGMIDRQGAGGSLHGGVQSLPPRQIRILGVPLDLGQSRRGVDMGPSAVRVAGLEARLESLGHRGKRWRKCAGGDR